MEKLICSHLMDLTETSDWVRSAVKRGILTISNPSKLVCGERFPLSRNLCNGDDIGCVGPHDLECPYPQDASYILVENIK